VIRCIRESDEPKPDLMARFGLTEIQAEDILEIRLRQLARLEGIRIEKELGELRTEHGQLTKLLDSRNEMTRLIQKEIGEDAKRFGDERRTLIEAVTPISQGEIAVPDEPVTVIVSKNGWVRSRQGHGIDPTGITYKTGDFPWLVAETRTVWPLIVIDSNGRSYSVRVSDLPGGRGDGSAAEHHDRLPGRRQDGAGAHRCAGKQIPGRRVKRLRLCRQRRRHGEPQQGGQGLPCTRQGREALTAGTGHRDTPWPC
jgi:topoisomerase-4 subunit A